MFVLLRAPWNLLLLLLTLQLVCLYGLSLLAEVGVLHGLSFLYASAGLPVALTLVAYCMHRIGLHLTHTQDQCKRQEILNLAGVDEAHVRNQDGQAGGEITCPIELEDAPHPRAAAAAAASSPAQPDVSTPSASLPSSLWHPSATSIDTSIPLSSDVAIDTMVSFYALELIDSSPEAEAVEVSPTLALHLVPDHLTTPFAQAPVAVVSDIPVSVVGMLDDDEEMAGHGGSESDDGHPTDAHHADIDMMALEEAGAAGTADADHNNTRTAEAAAHQDLSLPTSTSTKELHPKHTSEADGSDAEEGHFAPSSLGPHTRTPARSYRPRAHISPWIMKNRKLQKKRRTHQKTQALLQESSGGRAADSSVAGHKRKRSQGTSGVAYAIEIDDEDEIRVVGYVNIEEEEAEEDERKGEQHREEGAAGTSASAAANDTDTHPSHHLNNATDDVPVSKKPRFDLTHTSTHPQRCRPPAAMVHDETDSASSPDRRSRERRHSLDSGDAGIAARTRAQSAQSARPNAEWDEWINSNSQSLHHTRLHTQCEQLLTQHIMDMD